MSHSPSCLEARRAKLLRSALSTLPRCAVTVLVVTLCAECGSVFQMGDNRKMVGRVCYHCKQIVKEGEGHDCWSTTEAALTRGLSEDLQEAWTRLRETAVTFGEQRIYASHKSIMFSRDSCYFFVRPKTNFLELCVFLGRAVKGPQVRRVDQASKSKVVHVIHIRHRDEVEAPITDWLREAYQLSDTISLKPGGKSRSPSGSPKQGANAKQKSSAQVKPKTRR